MTVDLKKFIRDVPDFPKPGIMFKDITPLLKDAGAYRHTIDLLCEPFRTHKIDKVIGIESRGFIFAAGMALSLGCGIVPIRKKGKLPAKTISVTYELEYGTDTVEIHEDAIEPGEIVILVDDVLATGGTLSGSARLLEKLNARIMAVSTVIELTFLNGREKLKNYPYSTLISY